MDFSSQIALLLERDRAQTASLEALALKVDSLSSNLTSLLSENAILKRTIADQELVIAEVSRTAVPDGHWIWETTSTAGDEPGGRWVWSLEKYFIPKAAVACSGPPASFETLPVELFRIVFDLLPRRDQMVLFLVSIRVLALSAAILRRPSATLDAFTVTAFILPHLSVSRVVPFLMPRELFLEGEAPAVWEDSIATSVASGAGSDEAAAVPVDTLGLELDFIEQLAGWTPLLSRLDPARLCLYVFPDVWKGRRPTASRMARKQVDAFSGRWNRLAHCQYMGPESVLFDEYRPTFALGACMRRSAPDPSESHRSIKRMAKLVNNVYTCSSKVCQADLLKLLEPVDEDEQVESDSEYILKVRLSSRIHATPSSA